MKYNYHLPRTIVVGATVGGSEIDHKWKLKLRWTKKSTFAEVPSKRDKHYCKNLPCPHFRMSKTWYATSINRTVLGIFQISILKSTNFYLESISTTSFLVICWAATMKPRQKYKDQIFSQIFLSSALDSAFVAKHTNQPSTYFVMRVTEVYYTLPSWLFLCICGVYGFFRYEQILFLQLLLTFTLLFMPSSIKYWPMFVFHSCVSLQRKCLLKSYNF